MSTAGGLVFIGATTDSKFRAFDSRTGKELWMTRLEATADTVPMTFQGRNGKQYVVIAAAGTNRFRMVANTADETADALIAFALPDAGETPPITGVGRPSNAAPSRAARRNRPALSEEELKASGPPLPDGNGKAVVVRMCTACHGAAVFSKLRISREGWEDEVSAMVERGAAGTDKEIRTVTAYLVKNFGPDSKP